MAPGGSVGSAKRGYAGCSGGGWIHRTDPLLPVIRVVPSKPESKSAMPESSVLSDLMSVIAERKANSAAERSYVALLLQAGDAKILGKIAEEAAEVVAASAEPGDAGRE